MYCLHTPGLFVPALLLPLWHLRSSSIMHPPQLTGSELPSLPAAWLPPLCALCRRGGIPALSLQNFLALCIFTLYMRIASGMRHSGGWAGMAGQLAFAGLAFGLAAAWLVPGRRAGILFSSP